MCYRAMESMLAFLPCSLTLTKKNPDDIVVKGVKPLTLKKIVKDIYDNGRSQILHGMHIDRLKSFEGWRNHAELFSRVALMECANRLTKYQGPDERTAFRAIPI